MGMQPAEQVPVNKLPKERYGIMIDPAKASYGPTRVLYADDNGWETIRITLTVNDAGDPPTVRLQLMSGFPHGGTIDDLPKHSFLYVAPEVRGTGGNRYWITVTAPPGLRWLVRHNNAYIAGGFRFNVRKYKAAIA